MEEKTKEVKFTFVDLFAGIGGFRLALEKTGGKCVFSSEIDKHACEMYEANYGENPYCDITTADPHDIPDFDMLCAGFPCQSFSAAGKRKGFLDETRGTLFFEIVRILNVKKPKAFILENVQNLEKHDSGKTLNVILKSLREIGYHVDYAVLNSKDFGVPQNRERIILVGNLCGIEFEFSRIQKNPCASMKDFLDKNEDFVYLEPSEYTMIAKEYVKVQPKSGLIFVGYRNKNTRKNGIREGTEYLSRTHKQPNRIYSCEGTHPTLSAQEMSGRYFIFDGEGVRKLTITECYRFMGFPESFKRVGSISQQYKRIGNSICVPMVEAVSEEVLRQIIERS